MRGTLSYVGRSASNLERARNINQLQPGTIQANPGVNANALRPYLGFGSITLYETTGTSRYNSLQTQVERRVDARRRVQRRLHVLADEGRRQRPRRHPAERLRRQRLLRHLGSRSPARAGVAGALSVPDARVVGGAAALGARQLGCLGHLPGAVGRAVRRAHRRSTSPASGRAAATQFYEQIGDPTRREDRLGSRRSSRATWFDRNAFRRPPTGTFATTQEKNSLRQPGFWDINMSFRKGFSVAGTAALRFPARGVQHLQPHAPRKRRDQSDPAATSASSRREVGNRTMQVGMQYIF